MSDYTIRLAKPGDVSALAEIERASAALYLPHVDALGLTPEQLGSTSSAGVLLEAQRSDLLWVATGKSGAPVGFAIVREVDHWAHIDELDVHPSHGRRGVGTALLKSVCRTVFARGYPGVTLCTFRGLPWTVPFYERQEFVSLPASEYTPVLRQLVESEGKRGLRTDLRTVMILKSRPG